MRGSTYTALLERIALPALSRVSRYDMWDRLRQAERFYAAPRPEREELRLAKLRSILDHAWREVPHYRRKFEQAGLVPADVRSFEDLSSLPITTKEELIAGFPEQVVAAGFGQSGRARDSGATSGTPLPVRMDFEAALQKYAEIACMERRDGWHLGQRTAHCVPCPYMTFYMRGLLKDGSAREGLGYLWSMLDRDLERDPTWFLEYYVVYPLLHRRLLLQPTLELDGRIDARQIAENLETLARFRPVKSRVYPVYAWLWAQHLREMGPLPGGIGDIALVGGLSTPAMRELIGRHLGPGIFDFYGSAEGGGIAAQCRGRGGMHVYENALHLEFVREGRTARPGETGCIVLTDLHNRAMPFIRYWTGDVGHVEDTGPCPCGLDTQRIRVSGRCVSTIVGADGSLLTEAQVVEHVLRRADLYLFQVVLEEPGRAVLRVTEDRQPEREVGRGADALRDLLGPTWQVRVESRERLRPTRRGKYVFVASRYAQDTGALLGERCREGGRG